MSYLREDKLWGNDDPLFPATRIARRGFEFEVSGLDRKHWSNASPIRIIFREAFERAGLPYFNPHSSEILLSGSGWINAKRRKNSRRGAKTSGTKRF